MSDFEKTKEFLGLQKKAEQLGLKIGVEGSDLCVFIENEKSPIFTCSFFKEVASFLGAIESYSNRPNGFIRCLCLVGDEKDTSFMNKADLVLRIKKEDHCLSVLKSRDDKIPRGDYVGCF